MKHFKSFDLFSRAPEFNIKGESSVFSNDGLILSFVFYILSFGVLIFNFLRIIKKKNQLYYQE